MKLLPQAGEVYVLAESGAPPPPRASARPNPIEIRANVVATFGLGQAKTPANPHSIPFFMPQ